MLASDDRLQIAGVWLALHALGGWLKYRATALAAVPQPCSRFLCALLPARSML